VPEPYSNEYFMQIEFKNPDTGYICMLNEDEILYTIDGGLSWNGMETGILDHIACIEVRDDGSLWAGGENDYSTKVISTYDNGLSWNVEFNASYYYLTTIAFPAENHTWISSYGCEMHRRIDPAPDWDMIFYKYCCECGTSYIPSIFFLDDESGWFINNYRGHMGFGHGSYIYYTNDLGDSIECRDTNDRYMFDLWFIDQQTGWKVGVEGKIYKTENAGYDWEEEESGTEQDLNKVFITEPYVGWIVGNNGTILYMDVGVGDPYDTEYNLVKNSKLRIKNYPNPTNGIVNLQFTVYNLQRVSIKIYDLHGREVATVMQKELAAGDKVVQYDISMLPPGVYLAKVIAGGERGVSLLVVH
jgi:photosystem II stability/assembly factor-like uncharacterized protein